MIGYQFALHDMDTVGTVSISLYGFKHTTYYDGLLNPARKLRIELIEDDWDGILRIITSLVLKSTTQSIIGKFSAYACKDYNSHCVVGVATQRR